MGKEKNSKDYLYGVPELLILRMLADREMYGYEIVRGIREKSSDAMSFGEGVIYPILHSLQKRRLLTIRRERVSGRPRVYYRLTSAGQKKLEKKASEWKRISAAIQAILDGKTGEPSTA